MLVVSGVRVDVRKIESMDKYAFSLLRATGSKAENIRLSRVANSIGYSLSEYGLLHIDTAKRPDNIFTTEKDIYDFLGEPYRHPRERNPELVVRYNNPISNGEIIPKGKQVVKKQDIKKDIPSFDKSFYY
jgi:DNA polymerase/3'-5' exonuclease PolX